MDDETREMVEEAYHETVEETKQRGGSPLDAHKEGVTAAAMLLSAVAGVPDGDARQMVEALNLRPKGMAAT